jgi:hypothetical protein
MPERNFFIALGSLLQSFPLLAMSASAIRLASAIFSSAVWEAALHDGAQYGQEFFQCPGR